MSSQPNVPKGMPERVVYTQSEVATLLGVDDRHVRRLRQAGELISIDVSLRTSSRPLIRYTRDSVMRFIRSREQVDAPQKPSSIKRRSQDVPCYF